MYYYYAYINEKSIVEDVNALRKAISDRSYIEIDESVYTMTINGVEGSIMGKYWDGQNFVDIKFYYYAVINEKNFVIEVIKSEEVINNPSTHIEVDSLEAVKIGQIYDPQTGIFRDAKFHEIAHTDTDWISVSGTDVDLTTRLDEMQSAINGIEIPEVTGESIIEKLKAVDGTGSGLDADLLDGKDVTYFATKEEVQALNSVVNGKAATSHSHSDYATGAQLQSLTTIVNGKAAINHTHSDYATAVHTHTSNAVIAWLERNAGKVALSNERTNDVTAGMKVYSETGGWTTSNGYIVVPKTGIYMVELGGVIDYDSGSLITPNGLTLDLSIMNSQGTYRRVGACGITADVFNGKCSSIAASSGGDPLRKIVTFTQGEQLNFKIYVSSNYNGNLLTCGINVKPIIVIKEL